MVDLTTLAEQVSPGVDPADLAQVAAEWAIDQPEALARVLALVDPGSAMASPDLRRVVHQARYGNPRQLPSDQVAAWRDLGFTTEPHDGATWPEVDIAAPITVPFGRMADAYDVIVVGSGCGAMAAYAASTGGARVLLVEVGTWLGSALIGPDALRNQRVSTGLETPAGPVLTGNPRVAADGETVAATDGRWSNNAFTVGGGMRVFGAQAWRFSSEDFRMASTYGIPAGSALADWPISYEDVAPYYSRVERLLGCAGDRTGNPYAGTTEPYPLPPLPMNRSGELLTRAAASLGWSTNRVPLTVSSIPFGGRPACPGCGACVGFSCRADAKNGTHNTVLPIALSTGRCDLVVGTRATRLVIGRTGLVTAIELVEVTTGAVRRVRCGRAVVAAGAVETARLLLLSAHTDELAGVGNNHDQVGRRLQAHLYPGAVGLVDDVVQDGRGPGPTVAVSQFRHGNDGIVGGGMLANDFVPLPMFTLALMQATGLVPATGPQVHEVLQRVYRRHLMLFGPIQEVTTDAARVTLSPTVTDHLGLPVAQFHGTVHPEDLRTADFMLDRAMEWLGAAGCVEVRGLRSRPAGPSLGQHQAGTCRMGDDPARSVVDPTGRVWDHPNLAVADTSVHVTNGAVNPFLTGVALALRTAELMLCE